VEQDVGNFRLEKKRLKE